MHELRPSARDRAASDGPRSSGTSRKPVAAPGMLRKPLLADPTAVALLVACLNAGAGSAFARTAPDPVNNPTIDYVAPERSRTRAALPENMPAIPAETSLEGFEVSATSRNRFGVDPASMLILDRRIVQYTVVITSPSGVRNIAYEAIDCAQGRAALLAIGRDGQGWSPVARPDWRPVFEGDTVNSHRRELARAWCAGSGTSEGAAGDLLRRLRITPQHYRY